MITVTTTPPPSPAEPKQGDAFSFKFPGSGNTYTCLVIESNRVLVIQAAPTNGMIGWKVGRLSTLGETWNAGTLERRIYTKVTVHLEP